jgi:hypothetical protein
MQDKRVLNKRETKSVENCRENVLSWLNDELPARAYSKGGRQRIDRLLALLKEFSCLVAKRRQTKRFLSAGAELNKLIMPYPSWKLVVWKEGALDFGENFSLVKGPTEMEAATAHCAMDLAELNDLDRLRRCICGKWFFAVRRAQQSCSGRCRHRLYEQSAAFKAKRRAYMRKYYRLKVSGKVK